jgi:hypothetical protein
MNPKKLLAQELEYGSLLLLVWSKIGAAILGMSIATTLWGSN